MEKYKNNFVVTKDEYMEQPISERAFSSLHSAANWFNRITARMRKVSYGEVDALRREGKTIYDIEIQDWNQSDNGYDDERLYSFRGLFVKA